MATQYSITQFPSNTLNTGDELSLSGSNNLVWRDGTKVKLYNGSKTIQLDDNGSDLAISGNLVAWAADDDLLLYNGDKTTELINKKSRDVQLAGNKLVWSSATIGTNGVQKDEIYYYNGEKTVQLTSGGNDTDPHLASDHTAFLDSSKNVRLYHIPTGNTRTISANGNNADIQIEGNFVVWRSIAADDIFLYNITTGATLNLSSFIPNNSGNSAPQLSGGNIVWTGSDGSDQDVYLYNIATGITNKLTNNSTKDEGVKISGNTVAWIGNDGNDSEIYVYDVATKTTTQMTNNTINEANLRLAGSSMAWVGLKNSTSGDVYLATLTTESASTTTLPDSVANIKLTGFRNVDVTGNSANNTITGNVGKNALKGLGGNDYLIGGYGKDALLGGEGDDALLGGGRSDTLTGEAGRDLFVFDINGQFRRSIMGTDDITDFKKGDDRVVLDRTTFTKLGDGALSFKTVLSAKEAETNSALITYVRSTGMLYYNENGLGNGFGKGGKFADLANNASLAAADFLVQA